MALFYLELTIGLTLKISIDFFENEVLFFPHMQLQSSERDEHVLDVGKLFMLAKLHERSKKSEEYIRTQSPVTIFGLKQNFKSRQMIDCFFKVGSYFSPLSSWLASVILKML